MPIAYAALLALCVIPLVECGVFVVRRGRLRTLSELEPDEAATLPTVSVIIPARDEAETIGPALASRLDDDYPSLEIIVVDDRSTDGTSETARAAAADDPRVRLLVVTSLPEGWLGKVHALDTGTRASSGEWLLFSDADVHISRGALRRAIRVCENEELDMLSLIPEYTSRDTLVAATWAVFLRMMALMLNPDAIRDPSSSKALGSGAWALVRRSAFERTPGFEWLRLETADDMALALMMKRSGARIEVMNGRGSAAVDIYRDLGEYFQGVEKNGGTSAARPWRFSAFMALFLAVEWAPLVTLSAGIASDSALMTAAGAVSALAATMVNVLSLRFNTRRWTPALLWPLGSALLVAGTVRATWLVHARGGVMWRGTFHPLDEIHDSRRYEL